MSRRLLLNYLLLTTFVLLVLEIPLGFSYARNERQEVTRKLERDALALAALSQDVLAKPSPGSREALAKIARRYRRETGGRVVIADARGTALVDTDSPAPGVRSFASRPEIKLALRGDIASGTRHSETLDTDLMYVAIPVAAGNKTHGVVRVSQPASEVAASVLRFWLLLAGIALIILLAAALLGRRLARSVAQPLSDVERAASAAGRGDLDVRAPEDAGPAEVRSLAASFNDTVEKLDELIRAREQFAADAAHQLRTPLTALRLRLENLERDVGPSGRADLDEALAEVERLSGLVDGLLSLARSEKTSAPETIELGEVVDERLQAWSPLVAEQGIVLVADVGEAAPVRATPGRLEQVLDNLLANAVEVSPPRSWITVSTAQSGGWVELHVVDEGPGLSEEERRRAFDRLWQGDSGGGSSGLGLAIVNRLVTSDGGEVELLPAEAGGIDAVVRLPAGRRPRRFGRDASREQAAA
jgi:signal transduction histidine kinase